MLDRSEDSINYITRSARAFDYGSYYHQFCDGFTREQTRSKLESDFEICRSESGDLAVGTAKWINEQIDNGLPLERTLNVDAFWLALLAKQNVYRAAINEEIRKTAIKEKTHKDVMNNAAAASQNEQPSLNHAQLVVESDKLVILDNRSIGSIIKSEGKCLFSRYDTLSQDEETRCGYCLCGILDVSSDIQQSLFTHAQWKFLKDEFSPKKPTPLPRLDTKTCRLLNKLPVMLIEDERALDVYNAVLKELEKATTDRWLLKMLAHLLNCYVERGDMFEDPRNRIDVDYMAKFWCEFFELMFEGQNVEVKWGQSASDTITQARSTTNSSNTSSTIVCEADDTPVACIRYSNCPSLVNSIVNRDQAALAIETKCILDDAVHRQELHAKVHTSVVHPFPDEPSVPSNWTRGTFLFPSKGQAATFPDNYLPKNVSPLRFKEDDGDDDDGLDRDYLDDATLVIKVKPQKQQQNGGLKSDNKKRNLEDIESETSDNEVSDDDSSNKKRSVRSS
ncbi:hypothetical protein V8B55DRAFT_1563230 [Mucor lusitanicus]